MKSCEQVARDILERMGIEGAQSYTAGDLVELGNIIAENRRLARDNDALRTKLSAADRLAELSKKLVADVLYAGKHLRQRSLFKPGTDLQERATVAFIERFLDAEEAAKELEAYTLTRKEQ